METMHKQNSVTLHGINISYEEAGKGEIPVIFIHGFPFDKSTWQPQIESLKKNYRVIAYDIRGFGGSDLGEETISIDLFASDLIQFMDALNIKKAIVCGLSMGGYIVMNAVSRFPERFEAIILSDTQCIADSEENKEKRYKTIDQINKEGLEKFAGSFVQNVFCKETLENKKELVDEVKHLILKTSPETITGTLKALAERRETIGRADGRGGVALFRVERKGRVRPRRGGVGLAAGTKLQAFDQAAFAQAAQRGAPTGEGVVQAFFVARGAEQAGDDAAAGRLPVRGGARVLRNVLLGRWRGGQKGAAGHGPPGAGHRRDDRRRGPLAPPLAAGSAGRAPRLNGSVEQGARALSRKRN